MTGEDRFGRSKYFYFTVNIDIALMSHSGLLGYLEAR